MSEEKNCMNNELCEEVTELSMEELEEVSGGLKLDPERLRKKVEDVYPT